MSTIQAFSKVASVDVSDLGRFSQIQRKHNRRIAAIEYVQINQS